jgi:hypothetical protein
MHDFYAPCMVFMHVFPQAHLKPKRLRPREMCGLMSGSLHHLVERCFLNPIFEVSRIRIRGYLKATG